MRLGMLGGSITRAVEQASRRRGAAEGAILAHVTPTSPGGGLALGQDRDRGVIAVQSFGREDMRFYTPENRFEHRAASSNLIGQGGQAERHAFLGVPFGLAVEWLMLPKLLEQDHREQAPDPPTPR